jgi:methionyl-tRNA formyltransferase
MRIAVICNMDSLAFPSLAYLLQKGWLAGVGILERNRKFLEEQLLKLGVDPRMIEYFRKEDWEETVAQWLRKIQADMVWVFGFPWKFRESLLSVPDAGFYNFHFGLFPKYRGADPIFWQIRNREKKGGLIVHKVTGEIDRGPIVWREEQPIISGENYGLHCQRMGFITANILDKIMLSISSADFSDQEHFSAEEDLYYKKPDNNQTRICWKKQGADEIEWLVNACNPRYGGALTKFRNMDIKLLEVTPAEINIGTEIEAGTIVHADVVYGLVVSCSDKKFIRINVLSLHEGYMSGVKLFSMGVKPGERFYDK